MGRRGRALSLFALLWAPLLHAQVPAQATTLALRGLRMTPQGAALAFDVRDGRGASVPGVALRDVQVQAAGRPYPVASLAAQSSAATVWVLDATRRARIGTYATIQQAYASWADSLRGQQMAVVAAGRPPRLVQTWTDASRKARVAVDNVAPGADEADLGATLQLGAETCGALPLEAERCAVLLVSDARDGISAASDSATIALQQRRVPIYVTLVGQGGAPSDALMRLVAASGGLVVRESDAGAAVASLRRRVQEAYLARVTGLPTGRAVSVRVSVRTADGRTLADSARVTFAAPSTAVAPPDSTPRAAERQQEGRWKLWLGLLSVAVAGGVAWLFFGRRARDASGEEHTRQETPMAKAPGGHSAAALSGVPDRSAHAPAAPAVVPDVGASGAAASSPAEAAPWLTLRPLGPGASPLVLSGTSPCVLGRAAPPADVAVPGDAAISARHAVLERHGPRVLLRDLVSTNGTTINGVPVAGSVVIAEGDVLRLGQTDLRVHLPDSARP